LIAVVEGRSSVETTDTLLDELSMTRRVVEQLVKSDRLLRSPDRAKAIEQEIGGENGGAALPVETSPEEQPQPTGR